MQTKIILYPLLAMFLLTKDAADAVSVKSNIAELPDASRSDPLDSDRVPRLASRLMAPPAHSVPWRKPVSVGLSTAIPETSSAAPLPNDNPIAGS